MNRELYLTLLVFAATVLGVYGFVLVLSPFLIAIAWALCLAAVSYPLYMWLRRRIRRPRLAALIMVIATALVIIAPLTFLVFLAGEELVGIARGGIPGLEKIPPGARRWLEEHGPYIGIDDIDNLGAQLAEAAPSLLLRPVAAGAWAVVGRAFTTIMSLVIMLATQYFVYTEARRLSAWVRGMLPLPEQDTDKIFGTLRLTTAAAVLGGIVVALVQGIMAAIGFTIVGVDAPIVWGIITCFFSLLPFGGAALVWVPMVFILYVTDGGWQPWVLLAWGLTAISGLDNILRPWLLRRTGSRVHPMLLFFAILSGIGLFGMSGIVFGPLLIAALVTLAEIYREYISRTKAPAS